MKEEIDYIIKLRKLKTTCDSSYEVGAVKLTDTFQKFSYILPVCSEKKIFNVVILHNWDSKEFWETNINSLVSENL